MNWSIVTVEDLKGFVRVATFRRCRWDSRAPEFPIQEFGKILQIVGATDVPHGMKPDGLPENAEGSRNESFVHVVEKEGQLFVAFSYAHARSQAGFMGGGIRLDHVAVYLWPVTDEQVEQLRSADLFEGKVLNVEAGEMAA